MDVLKALKTEADKMIQARHDRGINTRIAQLESLARDQAAQIAELRGEQPMKSEPKKPPTDGVVYYLRVGGYIKIGWTSDLEKRMRSYAPDTVLLATEPGTRKDEQKRHRMFAVHRTHGREWYAMVPALMHHIDRVVKEHGMPEEVTFAAKPVTVPTPRPKQYVGGNYRGNGMAGERRAT
jgi:hypothetical protein